MHPLRASSPLSVFPLSLQPVRRPVHSLLSLLCPVRHSPGRDANSTVFRSQTYQSQPPSGYMSPEYALDGLFSVKYDVFSFGVVVLEILSGRRTLDIIGQADPPDFWVV